MRSWRPRARCDTKSGRHRSVSKPAHPEGVAHRPAVRGVTARCSFLLARMVGSPIWIRTGSPTLVFLLWIRLKGLTRLLRGAQQRISSAPTPEQLIADSRLEHQIRTWVPSWLPAIAAAGSRRPTASRSSTSVHSPTIRLTTPGGQYRRHQHRLERLSALVLNDHAMTS